MNFAVQTDLRVKIKESEEREKYLDLACELKNMEHEDDDDTKSVWCSWNNPKGLVMGLKDLEIAG